MRACRFIVYSLHCSCSEQHSSCSFKGRLHVFRSIYELVRTLHPPTRGLSWCSWTSALVIWDSAQGRLGYFFRMAKNMCFLGFSNRHILTFLSKNGQIFLLGSRLLVCNPNSEGCFKCFTISHRSVSGCLLTDFLALSYIVIRHCGNIFWAGIEVSESKVGWMDKVIGLRVSFLFAQANGWACIDFGCSHSIVQS